MLRNFATNETNKSDKYICITTGGKNSQTGNYIMISVNVVVMLLILSINLMLIKSLRKRKLAKVDKYFFIQSISDIFVGIFSIPSATIPFMGFSEKTICALYPFALFFLVSPYLFSWIMTIIISLDRCALVAAPRLHSGISRFILKYIIPLCILSCFATGVIFAIHDYYDETLLMNVLKMSNFRYKASITVAITTSAQIIFTVIVGASQIYLVFRVRKTTAKMNSNRHTNTDYTRRLTETIALMFFCAALCNTPQLAIYVVAYLIHHDLEETLFINRLGNFFLIILYSNSFINATIILARSSKLKRRNTFSS